MRAGPDLLHKGQNVQNLGQSQRETSAGQRPSPGGNAAEVPSTILLPGRQRLRTLIYRENSTVRAENEVENEVVCGVQSLSEFSHRSPNISS